MGCGGGGVERGWRNIPEAREFKGVGWGAGGGGGLERGWMNIPESREC